MRLSARGVGWRTIGEHGNVQCAEGWRVPMVRLKAIAAFKSKCFVKLSSLYSNLKRPHGVHYYLILACSVSHERGCVLLSYLHRRAKGRCTETSTDRPLATPGAASALPPNLHCRSIYSTLPWPSSTCQRPGP
jgi:hypothetical protein